MSEHGLKVWGSDEIYDELEPLLAAHGVNYKRGGLTQFSDEAAQATILTITYLLARQLSPVLIAYFKDRKRRITFVKPDGTKLSAENYTADEVEGFLREARDLYIEDKENCQD